jgi:hypothetical protein
LEKEDFPGKDELILAVSEFKEKICQYKDKGAGNNQSMLNLIKTFQEIRTITLPAVGVNVK